MKVPLSELHGRPIMDLSTATTIGSVDGVVLDAPAGRLAALTVGRSAEGRTILDWESIRSVGPDAVTVEDDGAIRAPAGAYESGAADGSFRAVSKQVLTDEGDAAGTVDDVVIDIETGAFVGIVIDGTAVPASKVMAVGDHAVIISAH